jgi:hypothetical protein
MMGYNIRPIQHPFHYVHLPKLQLEFVRNTRPDLHRPEHH